MDNDFDDNDYFLKLLAYYFIYQCFMSSLLFLFDTDYSVSL